jgi:hypothetical protein
MSDGQGYVAELQADDNARPTVPHHTSDYLTLLQRHQRALASIADEIESQIPKIRALAEVSSGDCRIAFIVGDLQHAVWMLREV